MPGTKLVAAPAAKGQKRSSKEGTEESAPATPTATTLTHQRAEGRRTPLDKPTVAIAYDFDGTLAPGNMQEHAFIPKVGLSRQRFWSEVRALAKKEKADEVLIYMYLMLEKARGAHVPIRRSDIGAFGSQLPMFPGVEDWFERINTYGKTSGVRVEHYIISSGVKEIVEGTSIAKEFKAIFASTFLYDASGVAIWPALALNYTTKTQYLFRINKGSLDVSDHTKINAFVPMNERPVPFDHMVYIGDGDTDIPCFRLVKEQGGHSIAVHKSRSAKGHERTGRLKSERRISFAADADYREGKRLDRIVKGIVDKLTADARLARLGKQTD